MSRISELAQRIANALDGLAQERCDDPVQRRQAYTDTIAAMLERELGGSMTAAEWHKLADERADAILRLRSHLGAYEEEARRLKADVERAVEDFYRAVNARAEADMLAGSPVTGAHHRALEAEIATHREKS